MHGRFAQSIVAFMLLLQLCSEGASAQQGEAVLFNQQHFPGLVQVAASAKQRRAEPRPMRALTAFRVQTGWNTSFRLATRGAAVPRRTAMHLGERQYVPRPITIGSGLRQESPTTIHQVRPIENSFHSYAMSNSRLDAYALQLDAAIRGGGGSLWERRLAIAQGSYYVITGLWPILHMQSFEKVTGPKTDDWLVKTVGAMITVVGGTLLISGLDDGPSNDMKLVAAGSAAALAAVDVTYVAQGRISRIYLLDAVAELLLIIGWGLTLR